jgi:hypothetical protein
MLQAEQLLIQQHYQSQQQRQQQQASQNQFQQQQPFAQQHYSQPSLNLAPAGQFAQQPPLQFAVMHQQANQVRAPAAVCFKRIW